MAREWQVSLRTGYETGMKWRHSLIGLAFDQLYRGYVLLPHWLIRHVLTFSFALAVFAHITLEPASLAFGRLNFTLFLLILCKIARVLIFLKPFAPRGVRPLLDYGLGHAHSRRVALLHLPQYFTWAVVVKRHCYILVPLSRIDSVVGHHSFIPLVGHHSFIPRLTCP